MYRQLFILLILPFLVMNEPDSSAMTLEEYGVFITSSGLVDTTTGLQWLDSDLTLGTYETVNGLLDEGWRIATGPDLFYLLMRQNELGPGNASSDNPLFLADFLAMTSAIGITADGTGNPYAEPWACMYFYGDSDLCQLTNSWAFTPYGITAQAAFGDPALAGVTIDIIYYLTEVPLYGNFEIGVCDTCVGRTLLVRNVPLPAGAWLLLSGLAVLVLGRKRT